MSELSHMDWLSDGLAFIGTAALLAAFVYYSPIQAQVPELSDPPGAPAVELLADALPEAVKHPEPVQPPPDPVIPEPRPGPVPEPPPPPPEPVMSPNEALEPLPPPKPPKPKPEPPKPEPPKPVVKPKPKAEPPQEPAPKPKKVMERAPKPDPQVRAARDEKAKALREARAAAAAAKPAPARPSANAGAIRGCMQSAASRTPTSKEFRLNPPSGTVSFVAQVSGGSIVSVSTSGGSAALNAHVRSMVMGSGCGSLTNGGSTTISGSAGF